MTPFQNMIKKMKINNLSFITRVVKGIFVTHDRLFFFPVKCEMANFFLVNRDFIVAVKRDFAKLFSVKREINV